MEAHKHHTHGHSGHADNHGTPGSHRAAGSLQPSKKESADHAAHHSDNAPHDQHAEHGGHVEHTAHGAHAAHADHSEHGGHGAHVDHSGHEAMFRQRFWVSLILSIPVLLYSEMVQQWLGFSTPQFPGSEWIGPILGSIVFAYGGIPFLSMARVELSNRRPGMMTLISLAITVAYVYSIAGLFVDLGAGFFWELVTLIVIMLLGHWLEMRSVRQASGALNELAKLLPDTAERIRPDGSIEKVPVDLLQTGDLVLVRPGASIPADGRVESGQSSVNEAMITGESRPIDKGPGAQVIGGSINGDGSLRVRITATGGDTALAGIMRLVEEAQNSKSNAQVLADKAAGWLFYIALASAAVTAIAWTIAEGFNLEVLSRVVTVLVIACPHALGLAIPLVVSLTTAISARNGVLVRDRLAMEAARQINTIVFDKTGTLTKGEQGLVGIQTADGTSQEEAIALAAAIEGDSEHIVARALREAAAARKLELPAVTDFEAIKGRGVRAQVNGHTVYVGGPRLMESLQIEPGPQLAAFAKEAGSKGQTVVYLVRDGRAEAAFSLADVIREESRQAVKRLHDMGIEVAMLTGDSRDVARSVAEELGIDTYFAEVLPEHKDQKVAELQAQGKRVAMVGDGVNDAPALTRADVGIAIGGGTDVAIESADIVLVQSNPLDVVKLIEISRASYRKMVQNLIWATGYNVVAIPLAAGVLAPLGILLSPAVGAIFMSLSTIVVAINAQLLRRLRLQG